MAQSLALFTPTNITLIIPKFNVLPVPFTLTDTDYCNTGNASSAIFDSLIFARYVAR